MDFVAVTEQMTPHQQSAFVWFLDVVTLKRPADPFHPDTQPTRDRRLDSHEYILITRLINGEPLEQQEIWVLEHVCAVRMQEAPEGSRLHDKAATMVVLIGALRWMAQGMEWGEAVEMSEVDFLARMERLREAQRLRAIHEADEPTVDEYAN